jgi:thymidine kinase
MGRQHEFTEIINFECYSDIVLRCLNQLNQPENDMSKPDYHAGYLGIITGSMISGKTEELIRRLKQSVRDRQIIIVFRSNMDTRAQEKRISSHDNNSMKSIGIDCSVDILNYVEEAQVIGIDEGQFFDNELPGICSLLANMGKHVIVAGLDMDFRGKAFGPMPELMALAEEVTKLHAICNRCDNPAQFSHRKIPETETVMVGAADLYEPICRSCFTN